MYIYILTDPEPGGRLDLDHLMQNLDIYVPRDEQLHHLKLQDFFAFSLQALTHAFLPGLATLFERDFHTLKDTLDIYSDKIPLLHSHPKLLNILEKTIHSEFIKRWLAPDEGDAFHFPKPQVIQSKNK
jgi:Lipoxygenase